MILDRDQVIGGLRLMKTMFTKDAEIMDFIESAMLYLKMDAPVEPEVLMLELLVGLFLRIIAFHHAQATHSFLKQRAHPAKQLLGFQRILLNATPDGG